MFSHPPPPAPHPVHQEGATGSGHGVEVNSTPGGDVFEQPLLSGFRLPEADNSTAAFIREQREKHAARVLAQAASAAASAALGVTGVDTPVPDDDDEGMGAGGGAHQCVPPLSGCSALSLSTSTSTCLPGVPCPWRLFAKEGLKRVGGQPTFPSPGCRPSLLAALGGARLMEATVWQDLPGKGGETPCCCIQCCRLRRTI